VRNLFSLTGRLNCALSLVGRKINYFKIKFYLYLTVWKCDFYLTVWKCDDLLSEYPLIMELRFDAMLYTNSGSENSDVVHIKCSRGPQVPHPCNREWQ